MSVLSELEERVVERGVRVPERLALLRALAEAGGEQQLARRLEEAGRRVAELAGEVRRALR